MKLVHNDEKYTVLSGTLEEALEYLEVIELEETRVNFNLKLLNKFSIATAFLGVINTAFYLYNNSGISGIASLIVAASLFGQIRSSKKMDLELDKLMLAKAALNEFCNKSKTRK